MNFKTLDILSVLDFAPSTDKVAPPTFTESSVRACKAAASLVTPTSGKLTLLHTGVYPSGFVADDSSPSRQPSELLASLNAVGSEALRALTEELPVKVETKTLLRDGSGPSVQVLRQLERGKHDLVALGGAGAWPMGIVTLSAVTERVLRATPVPALIAGTEPGKWSLGKKPDILAAVDLSEPSLRALRAAAEMAMRLEGALSVIAVNALPFSVPAGLWESPLLEQGLERLIGENTRTLRREVSALLEDLLPMGLRHELFIAEGPPASSILDRVQTEDHDIVFMGISGESGATLGGVTRRYLRVSPVPVMVFP